MKISKETIAVLKNFQSVNNGLVVDEGKVLKTISPSGAIHACCDVEENIPEFSIYNLSEFLSVLNLFDAENIDFTFHDEEEFISIVCGDNDISYGYAEADMIPGFDKIQSSEKYKGFDDFQGNFILNSAEIAKMMKASTIMSLSEIHVIMSGGKGHITLSNPEEPASNTFKFKISGEGDADMRVDIEDATIIGGDYLVSISDGKAIKFQHQTFPLMYFISPQK